MLIFLISGAVFAQYKYGLNPVGWDEYEAQVSRDGSYELVDLEKAIPGIKLDIRYATTHNFTGDVIYDLAKAYARLPVAAALAEVQRELKKSGYELKIFDGYRPYSATVKFYEVYGDTPLWHRHFAVRDTTADVPLILPSSTAKRGKS